MSYMNYVHLMTDFLEYRSSKSNKKLRILEIGVDRGQTSIPLVSNLSQTDLDWQMVGVDIRYDDNFAAQLLALECVKLFGVECNKARSICSMKQSTEDWNYKYVHMNSHDFLTQAIENNKENRVGATYDLVLLDSDHNYETTFRELNLLTQLTHNESLIVVDDFHGRHSDNDVFYADYESHKNVKHRKLKRNALVQGVNNAVIDFCKNHPGMDIIDLGRVAAGEPIAIVKDIHVQCHNTSIKVIHENSKIDTLILHRSCQRWEISNTQLYESPYPPRWVFSK